MYTLRVAAAVLLGLPVSGWAFDSAALRALAPAGVEPSAPVIGAVRDATPAVAVESVDLSGQFPPGKVPDQGKIGDCHDFAAVALTEAAWFRHYHEHLEFSEADLFAETKICTGEVCRLASVYKANNGTMQASLGEGGFINRDLLYILNEGLAPADTVAPYEQFESEYLRRFKTRLKARLLRLDAAGKKPRPLAPGRLDRLADIVTKPVPGADAAQDRIESGLQGFQARALLNFEMLPPQLLLSATPAECELNGRAQANVLLSELKAGRPVGVSIELLGLASWNYARPKATAPPNAVGGHAIVAIGYRRDAKGLSFHVRNSWVDEKGNWVNPELRAEDLCHVRKLDSLLTPEESAGQLAGREPGRDP